MKLTRFIHLFILLMQICAIKGNIVKGKWYDASVNTTGLITGEDLTILATVRAADVLQCLLHGLAYEKTSVVCYELEEPQTCTLYGEDALPVCRVRRDLRVGNSTCKVLYPSDGVYNEFSRDF